MLKRVNKDISNSITIEQLKEFANIIDTSRDDELQSILMEAIVMVEDKTDVSLSAMTLEYMPEIPNKRLYLYYKPIKSIVSIKNSITGADESYLLAYDKSINQLNTNDVIIIYTTEEAPASVIDSLRHKVLAIASAIYDGQTKEEINNILNTIPLKLC